MSKLKVLVVTHELSPYLESTSMAQSVDSLINHLQDNGHQVRVFMPRFGTIKERRHKLHEVIRLSGLNIPVGNEDNPLIIKVASLPAAKKQIYFLDNEDLYNKRGYLTDEGKDDLYTDNDERLIFYNKGVIEIIHQLNWLPDVIHVHGWFSSLVPLYARTVPRHDAILRNTKIVYTVYKEDYPNPLGEHFVEKAMMTDQDEDGFRFLSNPSCKDLYTTAVSYADGIIYGDAEVAPEVCTCIEGLDKPSLSFEELSAGNPGVTSVEFYSSLLAEAVLENQ